jgi:hypothetical protein
VVAALAVDALGKSMFMQWPCQVHIHLITP